MELNPWASHDTPLIPSSPQSALCHEDPTKHGNASRRYLGPAMTQSFLREISPLAARRHSSVCLTLSPIILADVVSRIRSFQRSCFVFFVMTVSCRRGRETERERQVYIYVYTRIYSDKPIRKANIRKAGNGITVLRANRRNTPTRPHTWTLAAKVKINLAPTDEFSLGQRTMAMARVQFQPLRVFVVDGDQPVEYSHDETRDDRRYHINGSYGSTGRARTVETND